MDSPVIRGLQNIRFFSGSVVSGGWVVALGSAILRLSGSGAESNDGQVLTALAIAIASAYLVGGALAWKRRVTSTRSAFGFTVAFVPMAMMSFALAIDHTFDTTLGDLLAVSGGVLNLAVIASSWIITQRQQRDAPSDLR